MTMGIFLFILFFRLVRNEGKGGYGYFYSMEFQCRYKGEIILFEKVGRGKSFD